MSNVNTPEYWDKRFATDWEPQGGRTQSGVFMDFVVRNLPRVVHEDIARRRLSILDAGCAEGDGTALLTETFPGCRVAGFDFSSVGVAHARRHYPGGEFFVCSFEDLDQTAGVIVSSNCLEHVSDAMQALRALARRAERYVIVLVPYAETYPPDPEHCLQVHADTFPDAFDAWQLTHRGLVPPSSVWTGYQLLLIYETPPPSQRPSLAPLPDAATVAVSLRSLQAESELINLREQCAQLENEIGKAQRYVEEIVAERKHTVSALNVDLSAKEQAIAAVRNELREVAEVSEARHGHLQFAMAELDRLRNTIAELEPLRTAMAELDRLRNTPVRRLARRLARAVALPRELLRRPRPGPPSPEVAVTTENGAPSPGPDPLPPGAAGNYDVIVLSIIDWDFRFQRPQQIATQFARNGHRVFFLSTTKFVDDDGSDSNLIGKIDGVTEVQIRSLRFLDVYGGHLGPEELDVLEESVARLARRCAIGDAVCHVHAPSWWPLARRLRDRFRWRVVYDCMDEWTNFPGFTKAGLTLEKELVRSADLTVVPAIRLFEKWQPSARKLVRVPNGVDVGHYEALYGETAILDGESRPIIGYFGALAKWVDVPLLEKLARGHPEATLVLAGGHFDVDLAPIASLPNVRLLGQRPYEDMPRLLWSFDVCIIPFLVNDITEATNPVKFYEYLFGGKPIVAPALPELVPFADVAYLAETHEEFIAQIDRALAEPPDDPRRRERRRLAGVSDWRARYLAMDEATRETFPLVSVVIVTYGGLELTTACLDSLREAETWPRLEMIVVDNASPDETSGYLRALDAGEPRVRCVFNSENLGFPAATNVGIRQAGGEIVVLLNNDTVVPPGLIGRLVNHLSNDPSIGLVCPMTNFCGNEARIEPGYTDLSGLPAFAAARAHDFAGQTFDIAVAAMYCVAARAEVLRTVGPLDEAFGIGLFEDDDYSMRTRQAGYRVVCARDAYVHHVGQGAFKFLSTSEYAALWSRNQARFETKWGAPWTPHKTVDGVNAPESRIGSVGD